MDLLWECVLATRPYTFTACLVPILVTTALVGTQNRGTNAFLQEGFLRALVMGISVQSAANLTNTYFDYINGVDTKDCIGGDLTLVEKKLTPTTVLSLSMVFYAVGFLAVMPILSQPTFIYIFALGIILSIFYTMNPIGLKYIAMGDITIFLCFGPLLMQATCLLVTGSIDMSIMIYSIPIGLLTEAILHANNTRDIQPDSKAKIVTLAILLGHQGSYVFYVLLILGAYISTGGIAYYHRWGCLLSYLTIPLANKLFEGFRSRSPLRMSTMAEDTAKFHLPFGLLLLVGVLTTQHGLVPHV